jgi:hypothetical protein
MATTSPVRSLGDEGLHGLDDVVFCDGVEQGPARAATRAAFGFPRPTRFPTTKRPVAASRPPFAPSDDGVDVMALASLPMASSHTSTGR